MVISYNNTRGIGTSYRCQVDIRAIFTVDSGRVCFFRMYGNIQKNFFFQRIGQAGTANGISTIFRGYSSGFIQKNNAGNIKVFCNSSMEAFSMDVVPCRRLSVEILWAAC